MAIIVNKFGKAQISKFLLANLRADIRWTAADSHAVALYAQEAEISMAEGGDARIELPSAMTVSGNPAICRIEPRGLSYSA